MNETNVMDENMLEARNPMVCENRNLFCYVCGLFSPVSHDTRFLTSNNIRGFEQYFEIPFKPNLSYVPEVICKPCSNGLSAFMKGNKKDRHTMKFSKPMIWLPIGVHEPENCYCCQTNVIGMHFQHRENLTKYATHVQTVQLPEIRSSVTEAPLASMEFDTQTPPRPGLIVPSTATSTPSSKTSQSTSAESAHSQDPNYLIYTEKFKERKQKLVTNEMLNDMARDLGLLKNKTELLASRLKEWKLTAKGFLVTALRDRGDFAQYDEYFRFDEVNKLVYCHDIDGLFKTMEYAHYPEQWRLFIDSSKESLKGIFHNVFTVFSVFL